MQTAMRQPYYFIDELYLRFQRSYYAAGVARGKSIGRYIFRNHAAGANHATVANGYTGADHRTAANPYIFANGYGFSIFQAAGPFFMVKRVCGSIDLNIGAEQRAAADADLRNIEHNAVEVKKHYRLSVDYSRSRSKTAAGARGRSRRWVSGSLRSVCGVRFRLPDCR